MTVAKNDAKPLWSDDKVRSLAESIARNVQIEISGMIDQLNREASSVILTADLQAEELREKLDLAREYKRTEAFACPLCIYEDGKLVRRCQMHKDMDALQQRIDGLEAQRDHLRSTTTRLVLENQQLQGRLVTAEYAAGLSTQGNVPRWERLQVYRKNVDYYADDKWRIIPVTVVTALHNDGNILNVMVTEDDSGRQVIEIPIGLNIPNLKFALPANIALFRHENRVSGSSGDVSSLILNRVSDERWQAKSLNRRGEDAE